MDKESVGKLIKERRNELNISQQALCDGICNRSALSRIECGEPNVGIDIICQLLDRLGLSSEVIYETEDDYNNQIRQIIRRSNQAYVTGNCTEALKLLDTIGGDFEDFSLQNQQRYEVINTMLLYDEGKIELETRLLNLEKSMRLTRPDYTLDKLPHVMTDMESQILRYIANTYTVMEDYEKAITIYYHLKPIFENSTNKVGSAKKIDKYML